METLLTKGLEEATERMRALYGENHEITDGNYDKSLAVKCINGTFVGKKAGMSLPSRASLLSESSLLGIYAGKLR